MTREQGDGDRARARPPIWPLSARRNERNRADDPAADDASAAPAGYPLPFDQPTHEISAFAHPAPSGRERTVAPATHAGSEHAAQPAGHGGSRPLAGSGDAVPGAGGGAGVAGGGAPRRPSRPRAEPPRRGADDLELEYPGLGYPQSGHAAVDAGGRPGPADPRSPSADAAGPGRRVERAGRRDAADPSAPAGAGAFSTPEWRGAPSRHGSSQVPEGEDLGAQDPSAPGRQATYGQLGAIVQAAEHAAEDLRERTEERAKERIAEAERSATYRIQAAEDEASELVASARVEAERIVREARDVAEQLHEQATAAAQQVQEQALAAAGEIEQRAQEAAQEIVERGRVSARERIAQAGDVAVELLADGQELSQHLNELALSLRSNAERLLGDIRGVHGVMTTRLSQVDPELMAEVKRASEPPRRRAAAGAQGDEGEPSRAKAPGRGEAGRVEAGREAGRGEAGRAAASQPQGPAALPWNEGDPPTGTVGVPEFHPPRRPWRR